MMAGNTYARHARSRISSRATVHSVLIFIISQTTNLHTSHSYSHMHTARSLLLSAILLISILGAGCLHEQKTEAANHEVMLAILENAAVAIQGALDGLDKAALETATSLEKTGISGEDAESVLKVGTSSHPLILTMITFDANGTVLAAEPESVKGLVGQDLSGQEVVQRALAEKLPVMSGMFPLAEGGSGVVVEHPVMSADGKFLGVISTMFSPYDLIRPVAEDAANGTPYTLMVIETGGHILYDPDPFEVGKETFGDALYAQFPEIDRVARHAAANRSGYDTYSFYGTGSGAVVRKETFWSTVGLHGTEWRVMVIGEE